jgi:hypothetical protein
LALNGTAGIREPWKGLLPYATRTDPCNICGRPLLGKGKRQDGRDA